MAKLIVYGEDARKKLQSGIDQLANTVRLPWVPRAAMLSWARSTALP